MAGLTNIKNQALTERIEDHLFQYILDERLAVGAKLPNEYELADRFGVSRGTIREAVKLLVYEAINGLAMFWFNRKGELRRHPKKEK